MMDGRESSHVHQTSPAILSGKGLTKYFGGLAALLDVDFQLHENEILGLIGPNGAGKTTLFHLIAGVHRPNKGKIEYRHVRIDGLRPDVICKKGIGRTFQITKPFLEMTTLENVMVGGYFGSHVKRSLKECQSRAEEILSLVGLEKRRRALASHLTLVERKMLELARALSTRPSVLLLDEVIAGLNPKETMAILDLIKKIRKEGLTIFMIEHVMKAVMGVSDRVIVLHHGQKIAEGTPEEVVATPQVIEAYLGGMAHAHS
jgi:branched-chain amino acid transport system ATP-binding protein